MNEADSVWKVLTSRDRAISKVRQQNETLEANILELGRQLQQSQERLHQSQIAFEQTLEQLNQIQAQLAQSNTDLYATQARLATEQHNHCQTHQALLEAREHVIQEQIKLQQTQVQLEQSQLQLEQSQTHLQQSQAQLEQSQAQLKQSQESIYTIQLESDKLRDLLKRSRTKVQELKEKQTNLKMNLNAAQAEITFMQESKFWRLRSKWIELKKALRISDKT